MTNDIELVPRETLLMRGTDSACAESRTSLASVLATDMSHMQPATKDWIVHAAGLLENALKLIEEMAEAKRPTYLEDVNAASLDLERAAGLLEAAAHAPESWGGMGLVLSARELLGAVRLQHAVILIDGKKQAKRRKGKPASTDSERASNDVIRRHHARLVAAGHHDATSQTAAAFGVSTRTIRRILQS
jgi:hypothetical protein